MPTARITRRRFLACASGAVAAAVWQGGAASAGGTTSAAPQGGAAGASGATTAAAGADPPWWDATLTVDGRGEYESRSDAEETRYAGSFAFAFAWTGTLQKDDEDYILVHKTYRLTDWRIEERGTVRGDVATLTAADIGDKPELQVRYILRREGGLHMAFDVAGFDVPKLAAADAFPLVLPTTAESAAAAGRKYDLFVKSGSNRVVVAETALARGPADAKFAWTWRNQAWVQKRESNVIQSSGHEARVRLLITPGR